MAFHAQYQVLDNPVARSFLTDAVPHAIRMLGRPLVAIRAVHLRLSEPLDPAGGLRRGFQLTEVVNAAAGEFAIYLSRRPEEYAFAGQLAHEVAHLLNPWLRDWRVEGLNTLFAERLLKMKGLDWSGWEGYLRDHDAFYGSSYRAMKEVADAVEDERLRAFLSFARWSDEEKTRMHLDVDAWLATLPIEAQKKARPALSPESVRPGSASRGETPLR